MTTGELELELLPASELAGEWARLRPAELLLPDQPEASGATLAAATPPAGCARTPRPPRDFAPRRAAERLAERFRVSELDGFGLEGMEASVGAAGALLAYLEEGWPQALATLRPPRAVRGAGHVYLDRQTRHNLDLFADGRQRDVSLVATLDRTRTAMGGRLLRERLGRPLRSAAEAGARLDEVEAFVNTTLARSGAREGLRGVPDLERLLGRVRSGSAGARHLLQLAHGLARLTALRERAGEAGDPPRAIAAALGGCEEIAEAITSVIAEDAPAEPGDQPRYGAASTPRWTGCARLPRAPARRSPRSSRRSGSDPGSPRSGSATTACSATTWRSLARRRSASPTISSAGRRSRARSASARRHSRRLRARSSRRGSGCSPPSERRSRGSWRRSRSRGSASLGRVRRWRGSTSPPPSPRPPSSSATSGRKLAESGPIEIEGGRHPVVEAELPSGAFVPNDCVIGEDSDIVVLTGPNMGGKSTYLRQTALIVLLAQCGCYVPAKRARIAMVDRIFSRVGAQDDLAAGRSTFMVEMLETASILHNATARSLVILDEVGRGTSTNDGLAIARSVVEHLHNLPAGTPRTLFATHYQELTELEGLLPRVENRSVAVSDEGGEVVLLHRIVPGGADRAYGVHVAELAGLPGPVVARARSSSPSSTRRRGAGRWPSPRTAPPPPSSRSPRPARSRSQKSSPPSPRTASRRSRRSSGYTSSAPARGGSRAARDERGNEGPGTRRPRSGARARAGAPRAAGAGGAGDPGAVELGVEHRRDVEDRRTAGPAVGARHDEAAASAGVSQGRSASSSAAAPAATGAA